MAFQIESEGNIGGLDGFIDDNEGYGPHFERRFCQRHTPQQLMRLEESYKKCAHPDVNQQRELAMELGLEYKQIKFWFQNKRTQSKVQNERGDNEFLHAENDRIRCENTTIVKNINCSACKGLPSEENDINNPILLKLRQENATLKSEYEKLSNILAHSVRRYLEQQSYNIPIASHGNGRPGLGVDSVDRKVSHANRELEKLLVVKTATNAMNELINLLNVDQPIWKKCSDGEHYAFNGDNYHRFFPNSAKHVYVNPRVEASKYSEVFPLNAEVLVDLFLKPGRWGDMFPTFFYKAKTVHVLDSGLRGTRSGAMQLIYEHMHALSPLIRPREFELVRYCKQIKTGEWVIADVSCKCSMGSSLGSSTWCWKLPSGCMIQQLSNNVCLVTCKEHVEVDGNVPYYPNHGEDLRFGAKRWIQTLKKTCDRYSYLKTVAHEDVLTKGSWSMIYLGRKMIKDFCSSFHWSEPEKQHQLHERDGDQVKIVTRKNTIDDGRPSGTIICASSAFWVPASPARVFHYLNDYKIRSKWDVLCNDCPVYEMMAIPTENKSKTDVLSILQPLDRETKIMIFQETMMGASESLIVYNPVNAVEMINITAGADYSNVPMLTSGFAIMSCGDGARAAHLPSTSRSSPGGGSVVTVAFQLMDCKSLDDDDAGISTMSKAYGLVSRAKSVIMAAFN